MIILELSNVDLLDYYHERFEAGDSFDIMRQEMAAADFDQERIDIIIRETDNFGHSKRLEKHKKSSKKVFVINGVTKWLVIIGLGLLIAAMVYNGHMPGVFILGAISLYFFNTVRRQ